MYKILNTDRRVLPNMIPYAHQEKFEKNTEIQLGLTELEIN